MSSWSASEFLRFPVLGDHLDVRFPLVGVDLDACSYTVQDGDHQRVGALALLLTAGQTAMHIDLPPAGTIVKLSAESCALIRAAVATLPVEKVQGVLGSPFAVFERESNVLGRAAELFNRLGALLPGTVGGVDRSAFAGHIRSLVGFSKGSTQFEYVTQGRNSWGGYSACGDLWNTGLADMGCRDPEIVNRNLPDAGLKWRVTENLSRPIAGAQKAGGWVKFKPGMVPNVGDLVLIGHYPEEIEHGLVHLGIEGGKWLSGDYGQVDAKGLPSSKTVLREQKGDRLGSRVLVGWINLDKIPRQASPKYGSSSSSATNRLLEAAIAAAAIAAGVVLL